MVDAFDFNILAFILIDIQKTTGASLDLELPPQPQPVLPPHMWEATGCRAKTGRATPTTAMSHPKLLQLTGQVTSGPFRNDRVASVQIAPDVFTSPDRMHLVHGHRSGGGNDQVVRISAVVQRPETFCATVAAAIGRCSDR